MILQCIEWSGSTIWVVLWEHPESYVTIIPDFATLSSSYIVIPVVKVFYRYSYQPWLG